MRLIDADALYEPVGEYERLKYTYEYGYVVQKYDIDHAPTIDAVEVVWCKDCEWYDECGKWCDYNDIHIAENGFCSYGERREDA